MLSRPVPMLALAFSAAALTACGGSAGSSGDAVAVSAGDDSCDLARSEFPAGPVTLAVTNDGARITEVYVYGEDGGTYSRVVGEVENIGPGTSRDLAVTLAPGTYEVACKPGQTGDGIRTRITVSGDGDSAGGAESEGGYDREIDLATDGTSITGLDGGAETGERIEFKLRNDADGPRTLELKDPGGSVAGEVEVEQGATGEIVVDLDTAGTWQVIVEGDGVDDLTADLDVG